MTVLAVFRSRSQTMNFLSRLQGSGIAASVQNTPKEANVGCGLSVRFDFSALPRARFLLQNGGYSAFVGFFRREEKYGRAFFVRI